MVRLVGAFVVALCLLIATSAPAHTGDVLSEYGTSTVDGHISSGEYEKSCLGPVTETAGPTAYQLSVCEQNDEQNDYWAVQISDFTNQVGDIARIWFDNDHSGTVIKSSGSQCTYGQPDEDSIAWDPDVEFADLFYCIDPTGFTEQTDLKLPFDGAVKRTFDPAQGITFEFSHPLDSGDPDDYSLAPHDTVGWCLTYDDQYNNVPFNPGFAYGEFQYPPGCFVDFSNETLGLVRGDTTHFGDVYKQNVLDEVLEKIREKLKHLVAVCKRCPPDPTEKLKAKINEVIKELGRQQPGKALKSLKSFAKLTRGFVASGDLPAGKGNKFLKATKSPISLLKHFEKFQPVPTSLIAGGQHPNVNRVPIDGRRR